MDSAQRLFPKRPLFILLGATSCGKTALLEQASADFPLSIISVDSAQVYKHLNIGTNKPSGALRTRLPHFLIDFLELNKNFSANTFKQEAYKSLASIERMNHYPIFSGGTGFYIKYLLYQWTSIPPISPDVQQEVQRLFKEQSLIELFQGLTTFDPHSMSFLHPHDTYRLQRTYAVFKETGLPYSSFKQEPQLRSIYQTKGSFCLIVLEKERQRLYHDIQKRTEEMFQEGLIDEFVDLVERGYPPDSLAFKRVIAYKEMAFAYTQGRLHKTYQEELLNTIAQKTKQYAKRQTTFFRTLPVSVYLAYNDLHTLKKIIKQQFQI